MPNNQDYYPDFYLKKRERDAAFRRFGVGVVITVVIALGVVVGVLLFRNQVIPPRTATPTRADDAARLQGLQDEDKADSITTGAAASPGPGDISTAGTQTPQSITPADQDYTPALSNIQTRLEGNGDGTLALQDSYADAEPASVAAESPDPHAIPAAVPEKPADREAPADPVKPPVEDEKPAETVKPAATSNYMVGAGSYLQKAEAESRLKDLGALNLKGHLESRGGQHTIVIDKTFDSYDQADALVTQLKGYGYGGAFCARTTR